ncbi:N-acetylglucosamine-6-phosphate deacetylase [Tenuibacillus multivorans]|uniref:N-acetylglucosamine-6-phosphate deacetylase n=2 Tax=Tenuibacillus multivorans TaxID=237069 RepID=A0A1H0C5J3_9BACI|nr:N-acetylglucosamine-6-phosphate deacetylase [Tenuibacillus multivorans]
MGDGMRTIIKNVDIYLEDSLIKKGSVLIRHGKIESISEKHLNQSDTQMIDGRGKRLIPGFIDGHIHGAVGYDVMDGVEALKRMSQALPREGTTSFVATTITNPLEEIEQAIQAIHQFESSPGNAEVLGAHVEGPFIERGKAGAQPLNHILNPDLDVVKRWLDLADDSIKTITIAPELDIDGRFIQFLVEHDVNVSAGHTAANYGDIKQSVEKGVSQITHLCNAMPGIHHRDVGAVGAAMLMDNLMSELIADRIHVSDEMLKLIFQTIGPERLIMITDAMRAKGMSEGTYTLGGQQVTVKDGRATLSNGTLAGSVLTMDQAARNLLEVTEANFRDIIQMASVNPAKQLGVFEQKGSIAVGKDADLLIVDEQFHIEHTFCRGVLS